MSKYPHLIILYGRFQKEKNWKQQRMIDGGSTCMYREFAKKFGEIIYLAPQDCNSEYDKSINNLGTLTEYLLENPNAIVWSVKHCSFKDTVLSVIPNKKVYYSCCAYNTINPYCDISLVDRSDRLKKNARLWVKGKDHLYWQSSREKSYDFLIMGSRGDKNEEFFLFEMCGIDKGYSILWIGGEKYKGRIKSNHEINYTPFLSMNKVKNTIPIAKVGVILSEHPAEGFPQSFLEMTMCGLPVIYLSTGYENGIYTRNLIEIRDKKYISNVAKIVIEGWTQQLSDNVREYAIANYSLEKSYESILNNL